MPLTCEEERDLKADHYEVLELREKLGRSGMFAVWVALGAAAFGTIWLSWDLIERIAR